MYWNFSASLFIVFLPSTYYGYNAPSRVEGGIDTSFSQFPVAFFFNGNFLVCIFLIISGFIISCQIICVHDKRDISNVIIKRYLKLVLPVFVICLFVYLMYSFSLFNSAKYISNITGSKWIALYYNKPLTIKDVLYSSFIKIWFVGDDSFSTAFWMLKDLFLGCYLSLILSEIIWKYKEKSFLFYFFLILAFITLNSYYVLFVFGTMLSYMYLNSIYLIHKRYIRIIIIILGLFFGGYPTGIVPTNFYKFFNILPADISASQFFHVIGSVMVIYGIMSSDVIKKILSNKIAIQLSKISFSIYLLHIPLIFSFSSMMFAFFFASTNRYIISVLLVFLLTLIFLLILSFLFSRFIEIPYNKFVNKLLENVNKK